MVLATYSPCGYGEGSLLNSFLCSLVEMKSLWEVIGGPWAKPLYYSSVHIFIYFVLGEYKEGIQTYIIPFLNQVVWR